MGGNKHASVPKAWLKSRFSIRDDDHPTGKCDIFKSFSFPCLFWKSEYTLIDTDVGIFMR